MGPTCKNCGFELQNRHYSVDNCPSCGKDFWHNDLELLEDRLAKVEAFIANKFPNG